MGRGGRGPSLHFPFERLAPKFKVNSRSRLCIFHSDLLMLYVCRLALQVQNRGIFKATQRSSSLNGPPTTTAVSLQHGHQTALATQQLDLGLGFRVGPDREALEHRQGDVVSG